MTATALPSSPRAPRIGRKGWLALALAGGAAILAGTALIAQIEGDRGIAPVAVSQDIEISGIEVSATGKNAEEARANGWAEAKRKAWAKAGGPEMPDGQIDSMVSSIVIGREQIGPRRYIATLGVIFDRTRAGQYIGTGDGTATVHSAPMLTIPVLYSGGTSQVYEVRGAWQAAWARFKPGASGMDYVRPSGSGGDSLMITSGQVTRRSRRWWGNLLSTFDAADVLFPVARLERQWPGGPVRGTFTARYGPDDAVLGSFTLTANSEADLPKMLDEAVRRIDGIYNAALVAGTLKPDPSLRAQPALDPAVVKMIEDAAKAEAPAVDAPVPGAVPTPGASPSAAPTPVQEARVTSITVQFSSPDARAVDTALASVRSVPGVKGAATTSLAMGGTSVMRVSFAGSMDELRAALQSRGWSVSAGANALSIRR